MKKTYLISLLLFSIVSQAQIILTHNIGTTPIQTIMFSCSEQENWARVFVLEDFGITTEDEFTINSGQIAISTSYYGATAQFKIYEIDIDFPNSFPEATLLGSSQVDVIPVANGFPRILTYNFTTPIVIPAAVEMILVEVEKRDNPGSAGSAAAYISGSEEDDDFSWYKGCGGNYPYDTTINISPPRPNARFYINVTGELPLSVNDEDLISFSLYPNPSQDEIHIQSKEKIDLIKIYSVQGVFLKESFSSSIDVSELSNGLYFAKVYINGKRFTKKFIKS